MLDSAAKRGLEGRKIDVTTTNLETPIRHTTHHPMSPTVIMKSTVLDSSAAQGGYRFPRDAERGNRMLR
jgi:hypothetical protein